MSIINENHDDIREDRPFDGPAQFFVGEHTTAIRLKTAAGYADSLFEGIIAHCAKDHPLRRLKEAEGFLAHALAEMDPVDVPEICNGMMAELRGYIKEREAVIAQGGAL